MFDEIRQIIIENSGADPELVTAEAKLRADLGLNSLDIVMIATELEARFHTTVTEKDIVDVVTVGDVVDLLEKSQKI